MMEAITIGELALPDGVEALLDPEKHIAHIAIKAEEEVEETDAEALDVDIDETEPEVITEKTEEPQSGGESEG